MNLARVRGMELRVLRAFEGRKSASHLDLRDELLKGIKPISEEAFKKALQSLIHKEHLSVYGTNANRIYFLTDKGQEALQKLLDRKPIGA